MDKVRVALIGAGGMANRVHYPSLASFDDVELVGLCDLDREKLAATAKTFEIEKTFTDYQEMLDTTKPNAVYVLMPPHMLFNISMDVMERDCNLFIEKPPAVTTFQAENLGRAAESRKLVTAVGFQRRYHPLVRKCADLVLEHGPMSQVTASFFKCTEPQDTHPYYRGAIDILHCDAIHAVDSLRYYCGLSDVVSVQSSVRTLDCWYAVSFNAIVTFANGAVGILQTNWRSGSRFFKFELHGHGSAAYVDIDFGGEVWAQNDTEPRLRLSPQEAAGSEDEHLVQGFCAESRSFIDAVKAGEQVHNNLQDAAKSMDLVDRILSASVPEQL